MKKSLFKRNPNAKPMKRTPLAKVSKKSKKVKKLTSAKLKKKLDEIFSKYIRQKYAKEGRAKCYTCPKVLEWKELQCGHFVSRQHLATRFDEENVRPQCVGCNVFGGGRVAIFANNLELEQRGIVSALYRKSGEITKNFPYAEKIAEYQEKLRKYEE